ncbi:class II fructose-bisphosphate aldolase [Kribbella sp. NPDC056861]|uniref:class II fructose-bisphosphate aldolase n=1 Tax=Kribbella sp. NPDC056861 TaxID=3154857 RepID=UPI00341EE2B5
MPLVSGAEVVLGAAKDGRGVGAFNVIQLEHATALIAGAEQLGAPVILQISENAVKYHGALKPIAVATLAAAAASSVPVVVHLDHAMDRDLVTEAVQLGFTSVMYDASKLDYADNVAATTEVTNFCHDHGVFVEAEIGEVGGKDGVHAPGARTRPDEALAFAEATGVDALAVAVGSSHAMTERTAELDFALISALRDAVPVPLVLHGSSGVADADLTRAVEAGMTKVNIATHLNNVFTATVRQVLTDQPNLVDTRKYLGPARTAVATEVARLLSLLKAV